jgi:hypothetical protein
MVIPGWRWLRRHDDDESISDTRGCSTCIAAPERSVVFRVMREPEGTQTVENPASDANGQEGEMKAV